jgi:hypothetical protein
MPRHGEGIPQPPDEPGDQPEADTSAGAENGASAATNGAVDPKAYMKVLSEVSQLAPWQLARLALGEEPDEIVPSAEAVTFFEGTVAQDFKDASAGESIVQFRRERAERRDISI